MGITEATLFITAPKDVEGMTIDINRVCEALDSISNNQVDTFVDIDSINSAIGLSDEEKNVIFSFLLFCGVVEITNGQFKLVSVTAQLFIKSLSEYMKMGKPLIPVWNDREHTTGTITASNVFLSSNFLGLIENARKNASGSLTSFKPVFTGTTVRAVIVRRVWGRNRYLMQYSDRVGKYQLIGGISLSSDKNLVEAMRRKLIEEVPELVEDGSELRIDEAFRSQREDEEIFFSKRYNVYARYKTYIYSLRFKNRITRDALNNVSRNRMNRWVTIKEIERKKSKDGKEIFPLVPSAVAKLKDLEPNIRVKRFEVGILLEETWVKVILAFATISGFTLANLTKVISWFTTFISWIQSFGGQG